MLVKILKTSHSTGNNRTSLEELIKGVREYNYLRNFDISEGVIKQKIEEIIARGYCERNEKDRKIYHYIAWFSAKHILNRYKNKLFIIQNGLGKVLFLPTVWVGGLGMPICWMWLFWFVWLRPVIIIGDPKPPPMPNCYNSILFSIMFFFMILKFLSLDFALCLFEDYFELL